MTKTLHEALSATSYPGRGILLGQSKCGRYGLIAYFIMGRSVNSRNRTKAYDEAKLTDPSLVIYWPLRLLGEDTIVTNGDQTDTIYNALQVGGSFEGALRTREFEPDAPNYTPRISGILHAHDGKMSYKLSILKSDSEGRSCERYFYEYAQPIPGEGRLIHTYLGDGDPLPSFAGDPTRVALEGTLEGMARTAWEALDEDNKVSLLVRSIDLTTGQYRQIIFNKNNG